MNDITRLLCWGMTSHIPNTSENVVFLDYDFTGLRRINRIIKSLQYNFGLSTAYIAQTGQTRHHVVFLDRLPHDVWTRVIKASQCHDGYGFHLDQQGYAILRLIKKGANPAPQFLLSAPSKNRKYKQSVLHGMILSKFWEVPESELRLTNPDRNQLWESVYYFTDNARFSQRHK